MGLLGLGGLVTGADVYLESRYRYLEHMILKVK